MDLSVSSSRPTRALQGDSGFTKNDAARQTTAPRQKKAPRIAPGLRKPIIRFQVTRAMNHARRLARPHTRAAVRALTGSSAAARARSNASSFPYRVGRRLRGIALLVDERPESLRHAPELEVRGETLLDQCACIGTHLVGKVRRQQVVDDVAGHLHRSSCDRLTAGGVASASRARRIRDFVAPMLIPNAAATSAYDISLNTNIMRARRSPFATQRSRARTSCRVDRCSACTSTPGAASLKVSASSTNLRLALN